LADFRRRRVKATLDVKKESLRHTLNSILVNHNRLREDEKVKFDEKYLTIVLDAQRQIDMGDPKIDFTRLDID
jgi:hypothetical protein